MNEHATTENVASSQVNERPLYDKLLTYDQMADMLQVEPRTLMYWVAKKRVPVVKVGRLTRFEKERVLEALRKTEEPPCTK